MVWTDTQWLFRTVIASSVLFLLLGIAPAILVARGGAPKLQFGLPEIDSTELTDFPKAEALPDKVGEWRKVGFKHEERTNASMLGQHSFVWSYMWGDQVVAVSLDFPFDTWHPLSVCYRLSGWNIQSQNVFASSESEAAWPWEEINMTNDLGGSGYVCFCAFTGDLKPFIDIPGSPLASRLAAESSGIVGALQNKELIIDQTTFQIQVFCEAGAELSSERQAELRAQFQQFRTLILEAAGPAILKLSQ